MEQVTEQDRRNELHSLLENMKQHPERDWTEARKRVAVLRQVLEGGEPASNS
ncbi:hypothetical protein [Croceicoccus estronivorus]|uniref:hypothetical protein n=1 Tax=Croceicoccus estronivorus TaxID=1172626 RepID=UPI000AE47425|nr:hypothetical protein [Croceicoccus estronivorus]